MRFQTSGRWAITAHDRLARSHEWDLADWLRLGAIAAVFVAAWFWGRVRRLFRRKVRP